MSKYTTYDAIWAEVQLAREFIAKHGHPEIMEKYRIEESLGSIRAIATLGRCTQYPHSSRYYLSFNRSYLRSCSNENAQSTIWHEVLHACNGCMCHTGEWARMADLVSRLTPISISRTNSDDSYHEVQKQMHKHYNVYCNKCNEIRGTYYRYTTAVKEIMKDSGRFFCSSCKTKHTLSIVSDEFVEAHCKKPN